MSNLLGETIGDFQVIPHDGGFRLVDVSTFNPWPSVNRLLFRSAARAADYAYSCMAFKEGRSMTVAEAVTDCV
jgi:hypothetical protein